MVKIGLIGCGAIAHTHVSNLVNHLKGAEITEVFDVVPQAAKDLIKEYQLNAHLSESVDALVNSNNVDVVMVCSRNDTHVAPILAAIQTHKYVFTEKPLATTADACKKIIAAEVAAGQRFVQVGFMRRYDPAYQELKATIDQGLIGAPLMGYCRHFMTVPPTNYFKTENTINDSFIHESDIIHWLFKDDYVSVQVQFPRPNSLNPAAELKDPQIVTVKMKQGAIVNVYLNQNSHYGYEVRCQVIGEKGIAQLPEVNRLDLHADRKIYHDVDYDWSNRFVEAYQRELQDFIDHANRQEALTGPTAWDGYIATVTADCAIQSQKNEAVVPIELPERPELYQTKE